MPRYFFHLGMGDRTLWDAIGRDLPDPRTTLSSRMGATRWQDAFSAHTPAPGQILVVTNEDAHVVFVSANGVPKPTFHKPHEALSH